jgi:hypothetical protein
LLLLLVHLLRLLIAAALAAVTLLLLLPVVVVVVLLPLLERPFRPPTSWLPLMGDRKLWECSQRRVLECCNRTLDCGLNSAPGSQGLSCVRHVGEGGRGFEWKGRGVLGCS